MMRSKIVWLLSACLLATACQKRKYPDENVQLGKEDIYFKGYIDNEPISLKIGTDGYYCYSSYTQRADSIYVFEGELKKFGCNPCPLAFRLELSDYRQRVPGSFVPVDSALRPGSRHFIPSLPRTPRMRLVSHSNKAVASLRWDLSNGTSSQDSILNCEFVQPGPQTVSLTVRTQDDCESIAVNRFFIGGVSGLFACDIITKPGQNNSSEFKANITGGKAPFRYTWNFGDGGTSTLSATVHDYTWTGSYPVRLRIEDAENHVCESHYIHVAGNDKSSCSANISFSQTGSTHTFLDGVKIQWTDQSNSVLRSDQVDQPSESYFEVLDSKAYAPNEKGEAGRLLTLRFNVLLSDGNRKVWFKSEHAAIAVTYK